jgi:4-hydroxy-3-polyprenylbenzoate decarboxylase
MEGGVAVRELALVLSGGSGMVLASGFATMALEEGQVDALHVVVTGGAGKVLAHELGPEWVSAGGFRDQLPVSDRLRERVHAWPENALTAPIASGSHLLAGVVILPCSAGMAGSLASGSSRGLSRRVADVALKQRWPLILGIRETPMSPILLANLLTLANAGAHVVPPVPAFYLKPDEGAAMHAFIEHYSMRVLDLLGIPVDRKDLRWSP